MSLKENRTVVNISNETESEISIRLERVIRDSSLKVYEGTYVYEEFPIEEFKSRVNENALAIVRDGQVWSQLIELKNYTSESFAVWRFHFPKGADNSGFVGWLATRLKVLFGTGVFVVCGQNSEDGGIFDYWGCPIELKEQVFRELRLLINPQ